MCKMLPVTPLPYGTYSRTTDSCGMVSGPFVRVIWVECAVGMWLTVLDGHGDGVLFYPLLSP